MLMGNMNVKLRKERDERANSDYQPVMNMEKKCPVLHENLLTSSQQFLLLTPNMFMDTVDVNRKTKSNI